MEAKDDGKRWYSGGRFSDVRELMQGEEVWRRGAQKRCPAPPPGGGLLSIIGFNLFCVF